MKPQLRNKMNTTTGVVLAVVILLTAGCNANTKERGAASGQTESQIKTPDIDLHAAVISNNVEAVKQHIAAGSDLNVKDPFGGSSPLLTAALFGRVEAAQLLIDAGADLNHKNNEGSTALHTAAFFCEEKIVKILLEKGADKTIKNKYNATARESVLGDYADVEGIYKMMSQQLAPMGYKMDFERIQKMRPQIAELLK